MECKKNLVRIIKKEMKDKMTLDKLAEMMMERFDGVGQEFEKVYDRFDIVDKRFDYIEQKFDGVGQEFEKVYERFDKVDATMTHNHAELSGRLTSVESRTRVLEAK